MRDRKTIDASRLSQASTAPLLLLLPPLLEHCALRHLTASQRIQVMLYQAVSSETFHTKITDFKHLRKEICGPKKTSTCNNNEYNNKIVSTPVCYLSYVILENSGNLAKVKQIQQIIQVAGLFRAHLFLLKFVVSFISISRFHPCYCLCCLSIYFCVKRFNHVHQIVL